jgi:hypothetical protein
LVEDGPPQGAICCPPLARRVFCHRVANLHERLHALRLRSREFFRGASQVCNRGIREKQFIPRIVELIVALELTAVREVGIDDVSWQACRFRKTSCSLAATRRFKRFHLSAVADISRMRVDLH